jgi:hypothetical protein
MANYTTIDDPTLYFSTTIYTGDGNQNRAVTIDGTGMQPDWLWVKNRSAAEGHVVGDSVRGASQRLIPNSTDAEANRPTNIASFTSTGFTVANGGVDGAVNTNSATYVSWGWKAGTSFTNDASSTGIGSIDSAGSFNNDAGFSIVSYTGNSTAGATVGHGLSVAPKMILIRRREAGSWIVGHGSLGWTKLLKLNETTAVDTNIGAWNNTDPTSSVFSLGTFGNLNASGGTYVAYCFAEKQGYSKFGSYTGNGNADGTFVYTGFKPAFVLIKVTSTTNDWEIHDNKRGSSNVINAILQPNLSDAESTSGREIDFLSNGFKLRNSNSQNNLSGGTFIYMAFAENPFTTSTGVPACAR